MFNDLKVSSSIIGQVPQYLPSEYPNFVNFVKDYYRFMETNGSPLDILNGVQDLIDVDTYTGIDASAQLKTSIDADDTDVIVSGHVEFPRNEGLLKIDDEVILYKKRSYDRLQKGEITEVIVGNGGSGYLETDTIAFFPKDGSDAAQGTLNVSNGKIISVTLTSGGSGHFEDTSTKNGRIVITTTTGKNALLVGVNGTKVTTFSKCTRGFAYNDLSYDDGFTANNETTPAEHSANSTVFNQSYSYILYFLEELRSNYLVDFPANILNDNIGNININQVLKRAKDFYLSKGTPNGIEFYFKFLFQKNPELRNYKENLHSPSEATFQSKSIVRLKSLDTYDVPSLVGKSIKQGNKVFPVQTAENVFSFASLVFEFEISNGEDILPTQFTTIVAIPEVVGNERRLYVDSTYGFPETGVLRINQDLVTYTGKRTNYFECSSDLDQVLELFQQSNNINLILGDIVYDNSTLVTASDDPGASFVVYVGISGVNIEENNIGYQEGDLGFVSNVVIEDNLIISDWSFNDKLPLELNQSLVAGVTKIYYDTECIYMPISTVPYYDITIDLSNNIIKEQESFVKIPKTFKQSNENAKEDIPTNSAVGILKDGTQLLSWKSTKTFVRGEVESVSVIESGKDFNVDNPPAVQLDNPTKLNDSDETGTRAEISLVINGSVKNVYIKNKGTGYSPDTEIVVERNVNDDPNVPFRDAVLKPLIIDGQIAKVRIIDPGTGYTLQPTISIFSENIVPVQNQADLDVVVSGSIYKVNVDNPGSLYTQDPEYKILKGTGASGLLQIENGRIVSVDLVNAGQFYKSSPKVRVVDSTGGGVGAEIVATFDPALGVVTDFTITNPGLNYNEFNTTLEVIEEGSGEILQANVQRWTLLNNWDPSILQQGSDTPFNSSDGSLLLDAGIVDNKSQKVFSILGCPKKLKIDGATPNFTDTNAGSQEPHSPIIGWALDGAPIYGPYGRSIAEDGSSEIVKLTSGYRKKTASDFPQNSIRRRQSSPGLRGNYPMGSFQEDYEFDETSIGLDRENGRFCVTPEYPQGVYAYFMTIDFNNKKKGFPFFIGPKFKGNTFSDFNILEVSNIDNVPNIKRYLTPDGDGYHQPTDTGNFAVESIPTSTEAKVDSISVLASGSGYKVGDVVEFNNEGTQGFGAAGFVSTIKGKSVSTVQSQIYDYLEYDEENVPFVQNSVIQTVDGFSATVYAVNQKTKRMYLSNPTNGPLAVGQTIFDTSLTIDVGVNTQTSPPDTEQQFGDLSNVSLDNAVVKAELVNGVDSISGYFKLTNYNLNASINNFAPGKYIRIQNEYCKIVQIFPADNVIIVRRGLNDTLTNSYPGGTEVSLIGEVQVFDSSLFKINDIIGINNEKFRIIDIKVLKTDKVVGTKIINGGSGNSGTFYCFFDGVIQTLNGQASQVVKIGGGGEVSDLVFTQQTGIKSNPSVKIGTNITFDSPTQSFLNVDIESSTFEHVLCVERQAFSSPAENHYGRTTVNRLRFINGEVKKYEENRILTKLNVSENELVQGDFVRVEAAINENYVYQLKYNTTTNPKRFEVDTGSGFDHTISSLEFNEGSNYTFEIQGGNANELSVEFFGPTFDVDTQTTVIGRKYFDVNIKKFLAGDKLTKFTIFPDDSDLTDYIMRINARDSSDFKDYFIKTVSEPINGEYNVVNSTQNYFEIYTKEDPKVNTEYTYGPNTISYITRSLVATGGINTATLTSGGFNYTTTPLISSVSTVSGQGAILEPISRNIGKINKIRALSSGYGYSPDPTQKPSVIFPRITKIKNNFIVTDLSINNFGLQYIFAPRIILSGGGLPDGSPNHAIIEATVKNGRINEVNLISPGVRYNSAPLIDVEKYYYTKLSSTGELTFKFGFSQFILTNDIFKFRAYYEQNGVEKFVDSNVNFFAKINSTTVAARLEPVENNTDDVNPLDYVNLPSGATLSRSEFISLSRKASITAIVSKSEFINGEKITINGDVLKTGFVTNNRGWQDGSSILRIENYNYLISENDTVVGSNSGAFGIVESAFGINAVTSVAPIVQTPKKFLNTKSFLGSSALKIQDSYRYQKFAYEIGTEVSFPEWKEGYQKAVHPTGYNLFARTAIDNTVGKKNNIESIVKVETNVNELVALRTKYNYLVTKNVGLDEVQVKNRLLTDVKSIKNSVVAAFEDISDQFDGVQNSFPLLVIDPVNPTKEVNGVVVDNYIEDYDVDQMVVLLDNIIQTYGTSWIVTDADKTIRFTSNRASGELMPTEVMNYRQFNDDTVSHCMSQITTVATDTFNLVRNNGTVFPAGIFSSIDQDNYMVFVDGAKQLNSSFTISAGGGSPTIQFTETLPIDSELSIRYLSGFLKNEFTSGTVTAGAAITLTNKPSTNTSKDSYFVFVDGVAITVDDYEIDGNKDLIFDYGFAYDSLIVMIDPLGVSLENQVEFLLTTKYDYKVNDGQLEIPVGFVLNPEDYFIEIAGITQTPYIVYDTVTSGIRKINFFEPPQRYIGPDITVGRQFVGLLYQRSDADGSLLTTPNYQFDDISKNIIHTKEAIDNFVIGDFVINSNELVDCRIVDKKTKVTRVTIETGHSGTVTSNGTFDIICNSVTNIFIGDRVKFKVSHGMTSSNDDELEVTAVNSSTKTITLKNISGGSLSITMSQDSGIVFLHHILIVEDLNTDESITNRDTAFTNGQTINSGLVSSQKTNVITSIDEEFGVNQGIAVATLEASNVSAGSLTGNAVMVLPGDNYTFTPNVTLVGGAGEGATATATVAGGQVTQISLSGGTGYDSTDLPSIVIEPPTQTVFDVTSATGLSQNDYIVIDNTEIVKITNISGNTLTVTRAQLKTKSPLFHGNSVSVQKVIPYTLTVQSFQRGFDFNKTEFILRENGVPIFIGAGKDIFVIVNGILQKKGFSYNVIEVDPDGIAGSGDEFSKLSFTEAPSDGTPFNCFYVGEQISIQSIQTEFNGIETAFDLRDVNGEIFSLIKEGRPEANISANLILFIDGVYQIPSTSEVGKRKEAYPDSLSSFKLFGSLIEFSSPPKFGSEFEGYIFVGSPDDYESINVDATVEAGDVIVQENEISSRNIINILSARKLAVTNSNGQNNLNPQSGINVGGSIITASIVNGGENYIANIEFNVTNGSGYEGKLKITEVDTDGAITGIEITSGGHGYAPPEGSTTITLSGNALPNGEGGEISISVLNKGTNFDDYGWWLANLEKNAYVRESLRSRRTLTSTIQALPGGIFPLTGKTKYTTGNISVHLNNISHDLPQNPDDDTNLIIFTLPATANFPARNINARYTTFQPDLDTDKSPPVPSPSGKNEVNNITLGADLAFDQIVKLSSGSATAPFFVNSQGSGNGVISELIGEVEFGSLYSKKATVIAWEPSTQLLYVKLDDLGSQMVTNESVRLKNLNLDVVGTVIDDDLIAEYQSLNIGDVFYYNF